MQRYVWLTMYFIGLVLISYMFFYFSTQSKEKDNVGKPTSSVNAPWKGQYKNSEKNKETRAQELKNTKNNQEANKTEDLSWTFVKPDSNQSKEKWLSHEDTFMKMEIWTQTLDLIDDKLQETLYNILGIRDFPTYKVKWKEIYVKKLKSIDYLNKKTNIEKLIERIWENIVEANLFGDKQIFVNLKWYYKNSSIMLIEYKWKTYLIVFPYKKYKEYKTFFKEFLFTN